jgi:CheY-like chemotaxis protein
MIFCRPKSTFGALKRIYGAKVCSSLPEDRRAHTDLVSKSVGESVEVVLERLAKSLGVSFTNSIPSFEVSDLKIPIREAWRLGAVPLGESVIGVCPDLAKELGGRFILTSFEALSIGIKSAEARFRSRAPKALEMIVEEASQYGVSKVFIQGSKYFFSLQSGKTAEGEISEVVLNDVLTLLESRKSLQFGGKSVAVDKQNTCYKLSWGGKVVPFPRGSELWFLDDDPIFTSIVVKLFERNGIPLRAFSDPLDLIKELENTIPEQLITDLHMPSMSGLDLLKAINKKISKVIVLTSDESKELELLQAGASVVLSKRCDPRVLIHHVKRAA